MAQKYQAGTLKINGRGESTAKVSHGVSNVQPDESQSTRSRPKEKRSTKLQQKPKLLDRRHKLLDTDIRQLDCNTETLQQIIAILQQYKKKIVITELQRLVQDREYGHSQQSLSYGIQELNLNEGNGLNSNENLQGQNYHDTFPHIDNSSSSSLPGDLKTHTPDSISSSSYGIQDLDTNGGNGTPRFINPYENLLEQTYQDNLSPINGSNFTSLHGDFKTNTQDSIQKIEERINKLISDLKSNIKDLSEIVINLPKELEVEPTDLNHGINSEMDETQKCNTQNNKVLELFKELMQEGEEYHKRIQTLVIKIKEDKWITTTRRQNEELVALRHQVSQLPVCMSCRNPTERPNIEPRPPSSPRSPGQEAYHNRNRGYVPNSSYKARGGYNK